MVADAQVPVASRSRGRLQAFLRIENLGQCPSSISDPRRHGRRSAFECLVPSAKVVIGEVESQGRAEIFPLLAERVRQTGQPPHAHPHRQVLSFNVRGTNLFLVWVPVDRCGDRLSQTRRAVASRILGNVHSENLNELRVIHSLTLMPENISHGQRVGAQAVCRQLKFLVRISRRCQLTHEPSCGAHGALAERMSENELCVTVNRDEAPSIADVREVLFPTVYVEFLLKDETPDFVALHIGCWNPANHSGEHRLTPFACRDEHLHDRAVMQSRDTRGTADAGAFTDELDGQETIVRYQAALSAAFALVRLCVALPALVAAKPLQSVAMFAESLAINTTTVAGHMDLDLSSGQRHNRRGTRKSLVSGFGLRLNPPVGANYRRVELWFGYRGGFTASRRPDRFVIPHPIDSTVLAGQFLPLEGSYSVWNSAQGSVNDRQRIRIPLQVHTAIPEFEPDTRGRQRLSLFDEQPKTALLYSNIGKLSIFAPLLLFLFHVDRFQYLNLCFEPYPQHMEVFHFLLDRVKSGVDIGQSFLGFLKLGPIPVASCKLFSELIFLFFLHVRSIIR
jgi:hypothetical protein